MNAINKIPTSPLDHPIAVTFFTSFGADQKKEERFTLRSLAARINTVTAAKKGQLPWLKLARFGDDRTDKNSLRHDSNVQAITGIEADYDGEVMTVDEAMARLEQAGIASIVYTSPSHTEDTPRWRVLCPVSREMPSERRQHLVGRLNGLFNGILAGESFTLSQSYYFGSVNHNPSHRVELIDGTPIDDHDELDEVWIGKPHTAPAKPGSLASGVSGPVDMTALLGEIMTGAGYHTATVRIAGVLARQQTPYMVARQKLFEAMEAVPPEQRDARWKARYADIDRTLADIYSREARKLDQVEYPEPPPVPEDPGYWASLRDDSLGDVEPLVLPEDAAPEAPKPDAAKSSPKTAAALPVVYFDEVKPSLDAADFVEGLLTSGSMAVVYGQSNSGKTFWASDMALHLAAGKMWNGREVECGGVLWLAMEGSMGIMNRVEAWKRHYNIDGIIPFAIVPVSLNLLNPDADTQPLIDTIAAVAARMEMPISLVVVDTLSRAMAGGNENAPDDMGALVTNGTRIQQTTKAAVLWIHHSGKDDAKGARGHSLLRAATDTEIEITAEGMQRVARVTKQREMDCSGEFPFTLKVVELGQNRRGKPVTSCVVEGSGTGHAAGAAPVSRLRGNPKRALEVLGDLLASAGESGHAGTPQGVPSVPEKWWRERFYESAMAGAEEEAKRKAFRRAADDLVGMKRVGMASRRVWLVRVSDERPSQPSTSNYDLETGEIR